MVDSNVSKEVESHCDQAAAMKGLWFVERKGKSQAPKDARDGGRATRHGRPRNYYTRPLLKGVMKTPRA